jgi:hypothetical protein
MPAVQGNASNGLPAIGSKHQEVFRCLSQSSQTGLYGADVMVKIYKMGSGRNSCPMAFKAKTVAGKETNILCTRVKGHKGPCQWVFGEKMKKEEPEHYAKACFTGPADHEVTPLGKQ